MNDHTHTHTHTQRYMCIQCTNVTHTQFNARTKNESRAETY